MRKYFLHDGTNEKGPYSLEELAGQFITSKTKVWHEGLEEWITAGQIEELQSLIKHLPPPISGYPQSPSYFPEERKSYARYWWGTAIVLAVIVIGVLIYKYSETSQAVASLQQDLEQKDNEAAERQRKNEELTAKNMAYRNNWEKYIGLVQGDYTYRELGGISGLDLTIKNNTEYRLARVEVQVAYIKTNGGLYKTETVLFENVKARSEMTLYAPDSDRGTSVEVRIKSISAPAFKFCYDAAGEGNGNSEDPWKCD